MSQASVVIKTVVNEMMSMSTTTKHKPRAATYVQPAKDINTDLNKELSKESFLEKETFWRNWVLIQRTKCHTSRQSS